ncbi:MAG: DUF2334 domain-containing protein [Candidatus Thorarchaeota archaeon]
MSHKSIPVDDGIALLSVHHVTPEFEDAVVQTCDRLDEIGISDFTLLVTPFYKMKRSNAFEKHLLFAGYLSSLGLEISMHGYSLQTKSGSEAEFQRMSNEQISSRLRIGISLMRKGFERGPVGFIPPMWLAPQSLVRLSKELKLRYCASSDTIYDLQSDMNHTTAYHIIEQEFRSISKADAFLELELGGPVQISLHPKAFLSGNLYDLILDMKDRLGYRFTGYANYLEMKRKK